MRASVQVDPLNEEEEGKLKNRVQRSKVARLKYMLEPGKISAICIISSPLTEEVSYM